MELLLFLLPQQFAPLAEERVAEVGYGCQMDLQQQYDDAMFDFSRGEFARAITKLQQVLVPAAIAAGHQAEKLRPKEQLVHTNLSLFYQKAGDRPTAEHHGLQARIAGWRAENVAAKEGVPPPTEGDPDLQMAKPKPPAVKVIRMPDKFPEQPWKKKIDG